MATPGKQSTAVAALVGVLRPLSIRASRSSLRSTRANTQMAQSAPLPLLLRRSSARSSRSPRRSCAAGTGCRRARAAAGRACRSCPGCGAACRSSNVPAEVAKPRCSRRQPSAGRVKAPTRRKASARKKGAPCPHGPHAAAVRRAVVQLGAYSNSKSVLAAWNIKARKYRSLQGLHAR